MDNSQKTPPQKEPFDSEADLNLLLYKSGKSVKNLILRIANGFEQLWGGLVILLLYLFRNIGWLLLGFILGLCAGVYFLYSSGSKYTSEITVKANFNSAPSLYNAIDYFNSLIGSGKNDELAKVFGITPEQAANLKSFAITPVTSEIITADLYNNLFLKNDRSQHVRQDTFWRRTIQYDQFKESLKNVDYPFQTITVTSKAPSIYSQLQSGIVNYISTNRLLRDIQKQQTKTNSEEEALISMSIGNLDSLRRAYNERLIRGKSASEAGSSQLTILNNNPDIKAPELELYDKMLELKDELRKVRNRAVTENEVIEIYTPFNPEGKKASFLESTWEYALWGLEIAAGFLVLKLIYSSLVAYDATIRKKKIVNPSLADDKR
jgi:hypothetical protein